MAVKKLISYIICKKEQLTDYSILPHKLGQLIFVRDSHELWFDWQDACRRPTRELYGKDGEYIAGLIVIDSEATFDKSVAILSAYYYFKDTNNLYYYDAKAQSEEDKWILLNGIKENSIVDFSTSALSSEFVHKLYVDYDNQTLYMKKNDNDDRVVVGGQLWSNL